MDILLLLVNIGLLACLIYVVRNMIKLFQELTAFKNMEIVDKELKYIITIIKEERDTNRVQIAEELGFYDDLIHRVEQRRTANLIEATKVK